MWRTFAEILDRSRRRRADVRRLRGTNNAGAPDARTASPGTNDTTRATALVKQDGILVKSGGRRRVGTSARSGRRQSAGRPKTASSSDTCGTTTTANAGSCIGSNCWVMTYATATIRQANATPANQWSVHRGSGSDDLIWTYRGCFRTAARSMRRSASARHDERLLRMALTPRRQMAPEAGRVTPLFCHLE